MDYSDPSASDDPERATDDIVERFKMSLLISELHHPYSVAPTLALLFTKPIELPRVKLSALFSPYGVQILKSRHEPIHGVFVHALSPREAAESLAAAGATITKDPKDWIAKHWLSE